MTTYPETRAVAKPAGRYRILIDDVDVTFFRGSPTPIPQYRLTEPYAYGATDIQFPQVHAGLETFGVGDLSWVRPDARVLIQIVDDPTAEHPTVLAQVYEGWVDDIEVHGRLLNLPCSGWVSGRANWMHRPTPPFHKMADIGHWAGLFAQGMGVAFEPWGGPTLGRKIPNDGDMSELAWMDNVSQKSQQRDGRQRAFMPKGPWAARKWQFALKNTTTKHFTLVQDDTRIVLNLQRISLEETNTYWGQGVSPGGGRWFNRRYPGLVQGKAPLYPFYDHRNINLGDTDADTDTGDGIFVLWQKLTTIGYLSTAPPFGGVYDQAMYDAVADLKRDAGLTDNGTMTIKAWRNLWNLDATGFSVGGSITLPLLQDSVVRKYDYTSNGSIARHNPDYDKFTRGRHLPTDYGRCTKQDAITWARADHTKAISTPNWAGTIVLNGFSGWAGGHDDVTGLGPDDIYEWWRMLPGQNVWLPEFQGGMLLHVSGVDVSDGTATLYVDTRARDLMTLAQVLDRDADGRRNLTREWRIADRGTKASGNMGTWDSEFGGILDVDLDLTGGEWNSFKMPMGEHGQVNRTVMKVIGSLDTSGEGSGRVGYCVMVVSRSWTDADFDRRIGDPNVIDADGLTRWEQSDIDDLFEDDILLFHAGDGRNPCGFGRKRHTNDAGTVTSAPITGKFWSDEIWSYIMSPEREPVVTVAVFPATDAVLKRGRVFFHQEDDAV